MIIYKKCRVVMLPSESKSPLWLRSKTFADNEHLFPTMLACGPVHSNEKYQDLFILSDDDIKVGDWYLEPNVDIRPTQCKRLSELTEDDKKIIATTDNLLSLPQLSEEFIRDFIWDYNDKKPIEYVLVAYMEYEIPGKPMGRKKCILKVDSKDNTVIALLKESWNKKEIEDLFLEFHNHFESFGDFSQYNLSVSQVQDWLNKKI